MMRKRTVRRVVPRVQYSYKDRPSSTNDGHDTIISSLETQVDSVTAVLIMMS